MSVRVVTKYVPYDGPVVTRGEARALGLKRYFTGKPCPHGHVTERRISSGTCPVCANAASDACHKRTAERDAPVRRAYRKANHAALTAAKVAWAKANPTSRKATCARYYEKNRAKIAADYAANPEKIKTRVREWCLKNPETLRVYGRNYRARRWDAGGAHTKDDVAAILKAQKGRCAYCRVAVAKRFHVDHIKALASGGSNDRKNLQITCVSCNCRKSDIDPVVFAQRLGLLI